MLQRVARAAASVLRSAIATCCCFAPLNADDLEHFFESEVRPVLVNNCLECHGETEQSGGLRLDSRAALLKGGEHGAAMTPGDVAGSRLVQAIRHDGDLKMPPEKPLSEHQQAVLVRWIELGAYWPDAAAPLQSQRDLAAATHWAFQPIRDPDVPEIGEETQTPVAEAPGSRAGTEIDAFIRQRLHDAGLTMSPAADRRTLIRRLSYTLTGLPPTREAVDRFVADDAPDAVERLVDELLASPAYGEHQARHWLDIARYSDTKGYVYAREERFWIHAWSYRDWVVDALNADMPYDRFLLLQIAADQVPDKSETDLAAMGFLTLGRRFLGVRRDIIDDRIDVVCRGTMALTVACARCHDHKYDPIPTADYYSLYGVFDSCHETMVPIAPSTDASFAAELAKKKESLESTLRARCDTSSERVRARIADYLMAQTQLGQYPEEGFDQILEPEDLLPAFVHRWRDGLRTARKTNDPIFAAWFAYVDLPAAEFASLSDAVTARLRELPPEQLHPRIRAAFEQPPVSLQDVANRYASVLQAVDELWKQSQATSAGEGHPAALPDADDERLRRVLYGPGSLCEVPQEPLVQVEYDMESAANNELWKLQGDFDRTILNAASEPRWAVALVDRAVPVVPRVFRRGNPAEKGDDVPRQFLKLFAGDARQPFATGSGRLELARAIVDPKNPLTARVMVNRVWRDVFGAGLVTTPGDFGLRSEPPSHPELLDWLTSRFIESGWSLKQLHRRLVLSTVFQQSSTGPLDNALRGAAILHDPANRLLWRMNVHRLSFEELRDSMLTASGQLDPRRGGRPQELFKPPYPTRRTIYGLVDRQFLPGTLRMFDFANPDLHIPQRSETTVPQQSLFLMNHPLVLEQCRAMAATVNPNSSDAVAELFQRALQRAPTNDERQAADELLRQSAPDELPPPPPTAADWSYGFGQLDETAARVTNFQPLPHFNGTAWQGGPAWPDGALGWVQLTAKGGHPGNDREHAAVRRWTAPKAMTITINSHLQHEPNVSDGVRAFVVSARAGVLATATVKHAEADLVAADVAVEAGETLDFVVDIGTELNSDMFLWNISIASVVPSDGQPAVAWNSVTDFPPGEPAQLSPLEQLAQVLLCSNEFAFVD